MSRQSILLIVASVVLLWNVPYEPCYIHGDEANIGMVARGLGTTGPQGVTVRHFYEFAEPFFYPPAITMKVFGDNLFGLRMSGVILGLLSVLLFYKLAVRWFEEEIAFYASLLFLGNTFFLYLAKTGIQCIQSTLAYVLIFYLLDLLNQKRTIFAAIGFGLVLGMAQYFYTANALLPILFVVTQVIYLSYKKIDWKWSLWSIGIVTVVTTIVMVPLLKCNTLLGNTDHCMIWGNYNWPHLNDKYQSHGDLLKLATLQVKYSFGGLFYYPDGGLQFGDKSPLLNKWTALLFLAGILCIKDFRILVPLVAIVLTVFCGGTLATDPPFYPHYAGVIPLLYLVIAYSLSRIHKTLLLSVVLFLLFVSFTGYRNWCDNGVRNIHYPRTVIYQYDQRIGTLDQEELKNSETYRFLQGESR